MNSNTYNKLTDDVINQIKGFNRYKLSEEQKSLIDELIPNEELRERYNIMDYARNVANPTLVGGGVNLVTPNIFNKILTNGPVAIKKLMNLYKIFN